RGSTSSGRSRRTFAGRASECSDRRDGPCLSDPAGASTKKRPGPLGRFLRCAGASLAGRYGFVALKVPVRGTVAAPGTFGAWVNPRLAHTATPLILLPVTVACCPCLNVALSRKKYMILSPVTRLCQTESVIGA